MLLFWFYAFFCILIYSFSKCFSFGSVLSSVFLFNTRPLQAVSFMVLRCTVFVFQADTDRDGHLSLAEMIDNPYVFYSTIFNDEDDYDYHDELR